MTTDIHKSFVKTRQLIGGHLNYPSVAGIYAFFLADNSNLHDFGKVGQIIYIGIAKDSLHKRDFNQHFKTGKTGSSTVRRSVGAILKKKLNLTAIPRGEKHDKRRYRYYKFVEEQILTDWLNKNIKIGYWIPEQTITYKELRNIEKQITIELKPTLDLDNRTRKFNPFANKLNSFKEVCIEEAKKMNYDSSISLRS